MAAGIGYQSEAAGIAIRLLTRRISQTRDPLRVRGSVGTNAQGKNRPR